MKKKDSRDPTLAEIKVDLPEVARAPRGKKNTRRWCKGKVGREHVEGIRLSKYAASIYVQHLKRPACYWESRSNWLAHMMEVKDVNPSGKWWYCNHERCCTVCGKTLGWNLNGLGTECPDFPGARHDEVEGSNP